MTMMSNSNKIYSARSLKRGRIDARRYKTNCKIKRRHLRRMSKNLMKRNKMLNKNTKSN